MVTARRLPPKNTNLNAPHLQDVSSTSNAQGADAVVGGFSSHDVSTAVSSPAQKHARMLNDFTVTLGKPETVEQFDAAMTAAVRKAVGAKASTPTDEVYNTFNAQLQNMPAETKTKFFQAAFDASSYQPGEAKFKPLEFFTKLFEIRKLDGNVIPPQEKTAHQFGPGGVVNLEATPNAPKELTGSNAIVRIAPGARSKAPGFSFIFPGAAGEQNQSRVLMSVGGDYSANLSSSALGLKTEGPEGELAFVPGKALRQLSLQTPEGEPTEKWMQEVGQLPAGTVLGTLKSSDPNQDWAITVKTGDQPITTNMMADRSLRFPRNVRPKGVGGWLAWGAAAVVLSPILAVRGLIKAFRS